MLQTIGHNAPPPTPATAKYPSPPTIPPTVQIYKQSRGVCLDKNTAFYKSRSESHQPRTPQTRTSDNTCLLLNAIQNQLERPLLLLLQLLSTSPNAGARRPTPLQYDGCYRAACCDKATAAAGDGAAAATLCGCWCCCLSCARLSRLSSVIDDSNFRNSEPCPSAVAGAAWRGPGVSTGMLMMSVPSQAVLLLTTHRSFRFCSRNSLMFCCVLPSLATNVAVMVSVVFAPPRACCRAGAGNAQRGTEKPYHKVRSCLRRPC